MFSLSRSIFSNSRLCNQLNRSIPRILTSSLNCSSRVSNLNTQSISRKYCDKKSDEYQKDAHKQDDTLSSSSIAEENKRRALKYMNKNEDETVFANEEGEEEDYSQYLSLSSGKGDAKQQANERITKYMPKVTGDLPDMETVKTLLENEHGAHDVCILDVRNKATFANWMIVVTALSTSHVVAIADGIQKDMNAAGVKINNGLVSLCGRNSDGNQWIAVDVGSLIIHVMTEQSRQYYQIETLWSDNHQDDDQLSE